MCNTSEQILEEARIAKEENNMPRYALCTRALIDEFGFTVDDIRRFVSTAQSAPVAVSVAPAMSATPRHGGFGGSPFPGAGQ